MSVSSIAKNAASCANITPEMALIDALNEIREGKINPTKVLIIHVEEGKGKDGIGFDMGFYAVGMRLSDHVALCEMHKSSVLRDMGLS